MTCKTKSSFSKSLYKTPIYLVILNIEELGTYKSITPTSKNKKPAELDKGLGMKLYLSQDKNLLKLSISQ